MINLKVLSTPRVLLSGFKVLEENHFNPTQLLTEHFSAHSVVGANLKTILLDVSFQKASAAIIKVIKTFKPHVVLMTGLRADQGNIIIEKRAINSSEGVDEKEEKREKQPVVKSGPLFYASTLPVKDIFESLPKSIFKVQFNDKPAPDVYNHTFYAVRHFIETNKLPIKCGFIYVPNTYVEAQKPWRLIYASPEEKYHKYAVSMKTLTSAFKNMIQTLVWANKFLH